MRNSLYIKDMVSIDHAYISPYGEILGNSVTLNLDVSGFSSENLDQVKSTIDAALNQYVNNLWIVEGFSEALVTINDVEYRVRARDFFPQALKDVIDTIGIDEYILIKTNGFEVKMYADQVKFIKTNEMWGMNTTFSFYEQLIVQPFNEYLTTDLFNVLWSISISDISVKVEVVETDSPKYENSLYESMPTPYVTVKTNTGTLEIFGVMGYIATTQMQTASLISGIVTDSVFIDGDSSDLVGNRITAADGSYIEWFEEEFNEKTNLNLHVTSVLGGLTLDNISQYFCAGYVTAINGYVIWLQGRNNGVKVSV